MDIVELPIVYGDSTLRDAFNVMQKARRSAVVFRDGSDLWLTEAVDIARGLMENKNNLSRLHERQKLHVPSLLRLGTLGVSLADPLSTWREMESFLDETQQLYAILATGKNQIVLVSRHESGITNLEPAPRTCYCTSYPPRCYGTGSVKGGNCSNGHKGSVYCVS